MPLCFAFCCSFIEGRFKSISNYFFLHNSFFLNVNTLGPEAHKLSYTVKINFLVDCGDRHIPLPSLHHLQIADRWPLIASSRVRTDEYQKVQGMDCVILGWQLQISVPGGFPLCGQQNEGRCCTAPCTNLVVSKNCAQLYGLNFDWYLIMLQYLLFFSVIGNRGCGLFCLSSLVDMDGHPECSASVTLVQFTPLIHMLLR